VQESEEESPWIYDEDAVEGAILKKYLATMRMFIWFLFFLLASSGCASTPTVSLPTSTRVLDSATIYLSATGEKLEVIHDQSAGVAIIKLPDGTMAVLPLESAGLEGRYRDTRMNIWEHDRGVLLWIDGKFVFSGSIER
jgi:hypothetical protein